MTKPSAVAGAAAGAAAAGVAAQKRVILSHPTRGSTCTVYQCVERGSRKPWAVKLIQKKVSEIIERRMLSHHMSWSVPKTSSNHRSSM